MDKIEIQYRDWLVRQVNIVENMDFAPLLRELYRVEFYSNVPNDEDRAMDGTTLRDVFADEYGYEEELYFGPAKVLEVLIGVAKRVEFQLFGGPFIDEWDYVRVFWDLIYNLDLIELSGTLLGADYDKIEKNVTLFMDRKKICNKICNIFGIEDHVKNLAKMSIWAQMMVYIRKKWPV